MWMSHGDKVTDMPAGFVSIGRTKSSEYAAIAHTERPMFGLQFHPEVRGGCPGAAALARAR